MDVVTLAGAVSSGAVSALAVGQAMRRYWTRREHRNQVAFRAAVQEVVDASVADMIARQRDFERRQAAHLDRQDRAVATLAAEVRRARGGPGG